MEDISNVKPARRSPLVTRPAQRAKAKPGKSASSRAAFKPKARRGAAAQTASDEVAPASKSEKSRDTILEAAAKLFRRQGYSATTLRQIAALAEIKAGSIYYYFDSKEAILDEVLHQGLHRIFNAVQLALKDVGKVSHRRRIGIAIEAHLVALLEASDFTSANIRIYGQLPERLKKRHRPIRRAYAKYWDQLFLDARRAGEIRADIEIVPLRIFVLGALNWTVEWFNFTNKAEVLKLARRTELLIFDGVKKK
ncbi:MAG: TetR/AcrR family transcriptional regulator [Rhodopseudomonas sp.]|uniref:TetR/AcrR family transcriptional regulator n=1 Tax=Rhodopseudomonas sp. TaxID=1078 RepID=UPI0017DE554A|nr:TetR/AcrR family transcriptional regulator [Rhodopseudomonas sp.]NVN86832.1 TetR/AcrR family transcriptional regulator [Rhodopseudomonas sp.]